MFDLHVYISLKFHKWENFIHAFQKSKTANGTWLEIT